jgi:glutamyl-tRNA reductase
MHRYKVVTISHKTTQLQSLKEFLVVDSEAADYPAAGLAKIRRSLEIDELLYLNTCNRITFFFTTESSVDDEYLIRLLMAINPAFSEDIARKHSAKALVFEGHQAIRHLFSVSASLDSLVLGEREILGQLKQAYHHAREAGLSGDAIRLAIENCILFAKKIYSETRIGEKPVSVVSLAFRELMNRGISPSARLFIVGAGQTNHLMANLLVKYGFEDVHVFNRTLGRAAQLADRFKGGKAYTLEALNQVEDRPSVLITCTGATEAVIFDDQLEHWGVQKGVPFTIVDLAVPADVHPGVLDRFSIDYIDVASLKKLAEQNMEFRRKELVAAYDLLDSFTQEFEHKFRERQLELALMEIPQQVKALKTKAVSEVFSKEIASLNPEAQDVLMKVMDYMEKKYIAIPMTTAKKTLLTEVS